MPTRAIEVHDDRARAIEGARRAAAELLRRGVEVVVTGSLARGRFNLDSGVDFVVLKCPRQLKYAIEGIVEDELQGISFDVVYHEEIPNFMLHRFMEGSLPAPELT